MAEKPNRDEEQSLEGIITARKCDCCGHHEIGVTTPTGRYLRLKPGMRIKIIEGSSGSEKDG